MPGPAATAPLHAPGTAEPDARPIAGAAPDRLLAALAWCWGPPGLGALGLALLLALPVPLAMALAPDVAVNYTHHDVFIPLDAAWRALAGQWPHTDFYTPLGLSYVWQHGAAAWLWGMDGKVVIRANFVALPFVLLPALLLCWRRLGALLSILTAVLLTVLVTSPVFLDGPERAIAHIANYNRDGSALCALVCLWALCPARPAPAWVDAVEAVVLGVLLLILLYLKVTFFGLALGTTILGCAVVRGFWWRAAVALAVLAVGVGALELAHPGLLAAYAADLKRAGASNPKLLRPYYASEAVVANFGTGLLVAALALVTAVLLPGQRLRTGAIIIAAAASTLAAAQNFGALSIPLLVLAAVLAQSLAASPSLRPASCPALQAAAAVAVLTVATPFLSTQLGGTLYEARMVRERGVAVDTSPSSPLHDVIWFPNVVEKAYVPDDASPEDMIRWHALLTSDLAASILHDGFALVRQEGLDRRRIQNLAFSNPFPAAMRAPPPRGTALWQDEERTFDPASVTPAMVLGDADVIMVPKVWWYYDTTTFLLQAVQDTLRRDFVPHESRYWTAWVRK